MTRHRCGPNSQGLGYVAHGPQVPIQKRQKGVALGCGNNDHVQIMNAPISPRMRPIPWRTVFFRLRSTVGAKSCVRGKV